MIMDDKLSKPPGRHRKGFLLFCIACLANIGTLNAQSIDLSRNSRLSSEWMAPRFSSDLAYIFSSPARINENSAYALAGFSALTAGIIFTLDKPVYDQFNSKKPSGFTDLMTGPGRLYDQLDPDLIAFGGSGLILGSGYLLGDLRLTKTGWTALEAVFFSKLTTGLIKTAAGRHRPYYSGRDNLKFDLLDLDEGSYYRSMPSGHTSRVFALSTVLASSYESPWVRIPAYTLAGSVAVERVVSGDHWVSDVVIGGTIGYLMGRALSRRNGLIDKTVNVIPVTRGGMVGLNIRF